jgi:diphosphomevalonate decarboxylase
MSLRKATAVACANIAFIKYWGNRDPELNIPYNDSISMNLDGARTRTTVAFDPAYADDTLVIDGRPVAGAARERVSRHLDRIRALAGTEVRARVVSENNFPMDAGIASSASGFAALTLAATAALGLELGERELSQLARLGSGSAARSVPSGYVELKAGSTHSGSFAYTLYGPEHWDLRDIIVVVSREPKPVPSSQGHAAAETSPYFPTRLGELPQRLKAVRQALRARDIEALGQAIEADAISLHVVAMTSQPPIFYWAPATVRLIRAVHAWRAEGLPVYFTLDAGPNVHLICEAQHQAAVLERLRGMDGVLETIVSEPGEGARLSDEHLF